MIVAEEDLVMIQGRFSGIDQPSARIAVDILRIVDGVLIEHWDVIEDEASLESQRAAFRCLAKNLRQNKI